jgi:hypothetical protein
MRSGFEPSSEDIEAFSALSWLLGVVALIVLLWGVVAQIANEQDAVTPPVMPAEEHR